jgi:hypothetical protein
VIIVIDFGTPEQTRQHDKNGGSQTLKTLPSVGAWKPYMSPATPEIVFTKFAKQSSKTLVSKWGVSRGADIKGARPRRALVQQM